MNAPAQKKIGKFILKRKVAKTKLKLKLQNDVIDDVMMFAGDCPCVLFLARSSLCWQMFRPEVPPTLPGVPSAKDSSGCHWRFLAPLVQIPGLNIQTFKIKLNMNIKMN